MFLVAGVELTFDAKLQPTVGFRPTEKLPVLLWILRRKPVPRRIPVLNGLRYLRTFKTHKTPNVIAKIFEQRFALSQPCPSKIRRYRSRSLCRLERGPRRRNRRPSLPHTFRSTTNPLCSCLRPQSTRCSSLGSPPNGRPRKSLGHLKPTAIMRTPVKSIRQ